MLWRFYVIITILVRRVAIHPSCTPLERSAGARHQLVRSNIGRSSATTPDQRPNGSTLLDPRSE